MKKLLTILAVLTITVCTAQGNNGQGSEHGNGGNGNHNGWDNNNDSDDDIPSAPINSAWYALGLAACGCYFIKSKTYKNGI